MYPTPPEKPADFPKMFAEERERIRAWRKNRGVPEHDAKDRLDLVGVAFSGGGIRSATFNLGVVQALAKLHILQYVDYLSTVSGGGYIGSWLNALLYRDNMASIQAGLDPDQVKHDQLPQKAIAHLRAYSNYLTPKISMLSADTWTLWTIWLRNTLLHLTTLVTGIAALILFGRLIGKTAVTRAANIPFWSPYLCFAIAALLLGLNISGKLKKSLRNDQWVQILVILPGAAGSILTAFLDYKCLVDNIWVGGSIISGLYLVLQLTAGFWGCFKRQHDQKSATVWDILLQILVAGASGFFTSWIFYGLSHALNAFDHSHASPITPWLVLTVGPPAVLGAITLGVIANIGLMGRDLPDTTREWLGRLGAWACIYTVGWLAFFGLAIFGPVALLAGWSWAYSWAKGTVTAAWIATTIGSLLAAKSPSTGGEQPGSKGGGYMNLIAVAGPYVFAIGFIALIGLGIHELTWVQGKRPSGPQQTASAAPASPPKFSVSGGTVTISLDAKYCCKQEEQKSSRWEDYWEDMDAQMVWPREPGNWYKHLSLLLLLCTGICVLTTWRVDINEFSLHHFYRNRLVRCYLGASRPGVRSPDPFTNFDPQDDIPLNYFDKPDFSGPLPIINATLNLSGGRNLAWQERKGASFVFTPLYSGYDTGRADSGTSASRQIRVRLATDSGATPPAYYPTQYVAKTKPEASLTRFMSQGITLGTTIAISGAAANPNMGYHTSTAVAFLMTVFNARLGWWLGNPAKPRSADWTSPTFGLVYTLAELFGTTNADSAFVNLSDGGHFDNMGLYELVRRRCRYIILSDAEQDENLTFNGLGNAIRVCRTDFGAEIDINLSQLARQPDNSFKNFSGCSYAIGTITYKDPEQPQGILVYLKASLTGSGHEPVPPADVLGYHNSTPQFPHESTADQWFDESQFESYRRLGLYIAEHALNSGATKIDDGKDHFFSSLKPCSDDGSKP
jgi:hypothetical protein